MAMNEQVAGESEVARLGAKFIRWGLGLGIFGIFLGFGIIGHYLHGARHPTGEKFLHNMSLWYACPWTLSVYSIQVGSLGMVAFGAVYLIVGRTYPSKQSYTSGRIGFWLCVLGLLGIFCAGYVGYFVVDSIWPGFYYQPVEAGKHVWLLGQLLCVAFYFAGTILVWRTISHLLRAVNT
jgi:hypothetical protein